MTISLSLQAITATSVGLNAAGMSTASGATQEFQFGARKSFDFCVCPILVGIMTSSPIAFPGLNQASVYYVRARNRFADGSTDGWGNVLPFYTPLAVAQDTSVAAKVMAPAIVVVPEPILGLSGTADLAGEMAGFPAINLTLDDPVAWHAQSDNGHFFLNFQTSGAPMDTFALLRTNLPEAATVQISAGATTAIASGNTPSFVQAFNFRASPNVPGRPGYHGLFRLSSPQTYPFWTVAIYAPGIPDGVLHAEHLICGLNRSSKEWTIGATEEGGNLGSISRTRSGIADRQDGYRIRHTEFDISYITEAQFQTLYRDLAFRVNDPVLIVPNGKADAYLHDRILYGNLDAGKSTLVTSIHQTRSMAIDSII